jgi:hypothetical protein
MKNKDGSIMVRLHVVGWAIFVPSWVLHTADKPNDPLADLIQLDRGEPYAIYYRAGLILLAISFFNRLKNKSVLFRKAEDGTGTGKIDKEALRALLTKMMNLRTIGKGLMWAFFILLIAFAGNYGYGLAVLILGAFVGAFVSLRKDLF